MLIPLLEHIIKSLVDKPDLVTISQTQEDAKITIGVKVGPDDLGRVIGKDGQTIRAIRALAAVVAPAGSEVAVDIIK